MFLPNATSLSLTGALGEYSLSSPAPVESGLARSEVSGYFRGMSTTV